MKNGDMPAAPMLNEHGAPHHHSSVLLFEGAVTGLTKRELFAAMAMQGLCADPSTEHLDKSEIAFHSVALADVLLDELGRRE